MAQVDKVQPNLQRLQDIEQAAAAAVDEMSNMGPKLDRPKVKQQCELFLTKVQAAQLLVQEGAANPVAERAFKTTAYQNMSRVYMAQEKVQAVVLQVANMLDMLHRREQRQAANGDAAPAAAAPDAAGVDGMEVDDDFEDI